MSDLISNCKPVRNVDYTFPGYADQGAKSNTDGV